MTLRTVLVDDEPLARRRLRRLVASLGGVEIVGEAGDGERAVEIVRTTRPDLLLLDVQMPELDGVGVVRRLKPPRPLVIFVTAFESFAVEAFDLNAVDYVLKPVSRERLGAALERARGRHAAGAADGSADRTVFAADAVRRPPWLERLPVRLGGHVRLIDVSTIDWIEAADNYVVVHAGRETHVLREALAHLSASLDPALFARIHRSTVVRIDRVVKLQTTQRGDYAATLADGTTRVLSRTFRAAFEQAIGRRL
jgi:two-component system, LytTR family, response regulator